MQTPELAALIARYAPGDGTHATSIAPLKLLRASAPTHLRPSVYQPGLVIVAQGRKQARLGACAYVYDPMHFLVVSMTLPASAQIVDAAPDHPYLSLRIDIDAAEIAALLDSGVRTGTGAAAQALAAVPIGAELLDTTLRLVRLLDAPAQEREVLAPLALREIHYRVLSGQHGALLRGVAAAAGRAQRMASAVELLKRRYTEPLAIRELAAAAHMSSSTLHQQFKALTSMSPLQYQKHLRLHEARRLMLGEGLAASAAAFRVGYESATQFSREYRRLFGAPPRAEIEQLLAAGNAAALAV